MSIDLNRVFSEKDTELHIRKIVPENIDDAKLRRFKDKVLFLVGLFMILCVFIYFGVRLVENPGDKLSMAAVSSIIAAFLGYLTGKKTG
jgi:hypothetical protein